MTSQILVERVSSARFFGERKIVISPGEVYSAAEDAQRELCVECDLLQKRIQIALISGQEYYSFNPSTVTSVAQAVGGEGVLTIGAHDFNIGDMVHVTAVGGDLNGVQIVSAITSTSITLEGTASPPGAYTGTAGRVYHYLSSMVKPKGKNAIIVSSTGAKSILKRVGQQRQEVYSVEQFTDAGKPLYFWPELESSPKIGIQPIPDANYTLKLLVYRKPFPTESIGASADPILDSDYDRALYCGTLYYILSQFKREPGADRYIMEALLNFQEAKNQAMLTRGKREFTTDDANSEEDLIGL